MCLYYVVLNMKSKIFLNADDPRKINHIFDLIKSNKGTVIEYSDNYIAFDGDDKLLDRVLANRIVAKNFKRVISKNKEIIAEL